MYTFVNAIYIIPCWAPHRDVDLEENTVCGYASWHHTVSALMEELHLLFLSR